MFGLHSAESKYITVCNSAELSLTILFVSEVYTNYGAESKRRSCLISNEQFAKFKYYLSLCTIGIYFLLYVHIYTIFNCYNKFK